MVLKRTVCVQALSILFKNDDSQLTDSKLGVNIFATMRIIDFFISSMLLLMMFFSCFFFHLIQITYKATLSLHDNFCEHFGPRSDSNFVESDMVQNFGIS